MADSSEKNTVLTAQDFLLRQLRAALMNGIKQIVTFSENGGSTQLIGSGDATVFEVNCSPLPIDFLQRLIAEGYDRTCRTFFDLTAFSLQVSPAILEVLLRHLFRFAAAGSEAALLYRGSSAADGTTENFLERDLPQNIAAKAKAHIFVREQTAQGEALLLVKK